MSIPLMRNPLAVSLGRVSVGYTFFVRVRGLPSEWSVAQGGREGASRLSKRAGCYFRWVGVWGEK